MYRLISIIPSSWVVIRIVLMIGRKWVGWVDVYIQQQLCRHQRAGQRERWVAAGFGITSRNLGLSQEQLCSTKNWVEDEYVCVKLCRHQHNLKKYPQLGDNMASCWGPLRSRFINTLGLDVSLGCTRWKFHGTHPWNPAVTLCVVETEGKCQGCPGCLPRGFRFQCKERLCV